MKRLFVCFFIIAIFASFATPTPIRAAEMSFSLQITDKATGEALSGVNVSISTENSNQKFKSDDTGRVEVTLPAPPRFFNVSAKLDHYVPLSIVWGNGTSPAANI